MTAAEVTAVLLSLRVAIVGALVSLPFAIAVAYLLARVRFPGRTALDVVVHLPLVLPPVVTGWILLLGFGRNGPFGDLFARLFGLTFAFRWTGAALAAGVMGFPLMVRAIRISIEAIDRGLEQAAATLGASPTRIFATITLPLALPGLLAGLILGFARAIGEFGATITFVANIPGETQTFATLIYTTTQDPDGAGATWRLAAIAVAISVVALVLSEALARGAGTSAR